MTTYNPNGICNKKSINPTFAATNKINQNQDGTNDYTFDSSGNTTKSADGNTYIYDAENKQIEVKNSSNATIGQYWYDGDGKRVKKYVPATGEITIFIYDAGGKSIAEYSTIVESSSTAKVNYLTNDHLGSPRIITDQNGAVISRRDFQPFGEEITTSQRISQLGYNADNVRQKFTGYERDIETDLDFAQARYYAKNFGRFTTTDPLISSGREALPQSWNRYTYTLNNPLVYIDPLGTFEWGANLRDDDSLTDAERQKRAKQRKTFLDNLINKAKKHLDYIKKKYKEGSDEYKKAKAAIDVYGKENEANGVIVDASYNLPSGVGGQNLGIKKGDKTVTVEFDANKLDKSNIDLVVDIAHEGSHAKDGLAYLRSGISRTDFDTEYDGYFVESLIAEATTRDASSGFHSAYFTDSNNNRTSIELYNVNWGRGKASSNQMNKAIEDVLALPKTKGGLYELKRGDKTTTYYP